MKKKTNPGPELVKVDDSAKRGNRARIAITREQAGILSQINARTSEVIARAEAEFQNAVVLLCAGHVPAGSRFVDLEEDDAGAPQLVVQLPGPTTSALPLSL